MNEITNEQKLFPLIEDFAKKIKNEEFLIDRTGVHYVESLGYKITLNPNQKFFNFGNIRKTPEKYCEAELKWYDSQDLNVEFIKKHASMWGKICSDDGFVNSNYGYLIYSVNNHLQFERVIEELYNNKDSRRAVMIYNRPSMWLEYCASGMNDFICTMYTQHVIRDNKLHSIVNIRSNDFIYGFFNDFYWQCVVHDRLLFALKLFNDDKYYNLESGDLVWFAGSMHLYEKHFDMILKIYNWFLKEEGVNEPKLS